MSHRMRYFQLLLIFASCSVNAIDLYDGIDIKTMVPVYTTNIDTLFKGSIELSYQVNAQVYTIKSKQNLHKSAQYYYIPTASITSELQKKYNRPGHPAPLTDFKLDLMATMKLWSNSTSEQKDSAYYSLIASKETYNEIVSGIYNNIEQSILKIEFARAFLSKAEQYRIHMSTLLEQMNVSSQSGILKKSDRLFADVSVKKFEESILNVESLVEQYKSQINNITPANLYKDDYGVSLEYIKSSITLSEKMFQINTVSEKNFNILSQRAQLESDKYAAQAYNENFVVQIVTQHGIKENALSNIKNDENQVPGGYTYDNDGQAYIGLKVSFTGLNYQNAQQKASEYHLFSSQLIELDELIHQTYVDLSTYSLQYTLIKKRIANIDTQITLTIGVINSMMNEMRVDESNILDIFRNISSLSDLEMNRLFVQNELVDLTTKVKSINSIIPGQYVIN